MKVLLDPPTPEQHAMADLLLSLLPDRSFLSKHSEKERYITLDEQLGKSRKNKNAVGIFRERVSFMVGDRSFLSKATALGLAAKIQEERMKLVFPKLSMQSVIANREFFTEVILESKRESQRRQGEYRFAFSAGDLEVSVDGHVLNNLWLARFAASRGPGGTEKYEDVLKEFRAEHPVTEESRVGVTH